MEIQKDISSLLRDWEYEEEREEKNIRRIKGDNGRDILQVRLPLGIEQYEVHGRPDGTRPEGFESWYDNYYYQAQKYGREFVLDEEARERLKSESLLYYHRYLLFFQVQEFELCIRDTSRNIRVLKFVSEHGADSEECEFLEQYRPYILRMQVMAKALLRVKKEQDISGALQLLRQGGEAIRALPEMPENEIFDFERSRSLRSIQELVQQLEDQMPLTAEQELQRELDQAIAEENYERAARLRDRMRDMDSADEEELSNWEELS